MFLCECGRHTGPMLIPEHAYFTVHSHLFKYYGWLYSDMIAKYFKSIFKKTNYYVGELETKKKIWQDNDHLTCF